MGILPGPDEIDMSDSVENELFCMTLAGEIGLPVATARKIVLPGQVALAVERFDRVWDHGSPHRALPSAVSEPSRSNGTGVVDGGANGLRLAVLCCLNRIRLARTKAELAAIDKEILDVIETDPNQRESQRILISIAGISEVIAAAIPSMIQNWISSTESRLPATRALLP